MMSPFFRIVLVLGSLTLVLGADSKCDSSSCETATCPDVEEDNCKSEGGLYVKKDLAKCRCCPSCVVFKEIGEECSSEMEGMVYNCARGSDCDEATGTCVKGAQKENAMSRMRSKSGSSRSADSSSSSSSGSSRQSSSSTSEESSSSSFSSSSSSSSESSSGSSSGSSSMSRSATSYSESKEGDNEFKSDIKSLLDFDIDAAIGRVEAEADSGEISESALLDAVEEIESKSLNESQQSTIDEISEEIEESESSEKESSSDSFSLEDESTDEILSDIEETLEEEGESAAVSQVKEIANNEKVSPEVIERAMESIKQLGGLEGDVDELEKAVSDDEISDEDKKMIEDIINEAEEDEGNEFEDTIEGKSESEESEELRENRKEQEYIEEDLEEIREEEEEVNEKKEELEEREEEEKSQLEEEISETDDEEEKKELEEKLEEIVDQEAEEKEAIIQLLMSLEEEEADGIEHLSELKEEEIMLIASQDGVDEKDEILKEELNEIKEKYESLTKVLENQREELEEEEESNVESDEQESNESKEEILELKEEENDVKEDLINEISDKVEEVEDDSDGDDEEEDDDEEDDYELDDLDDDIENDILDDEDEDEHVKIEAIEELSEEEVSAIEEALEEQEANDGSEIVLKTANGRIRKFTFVMSLDDESRNMLIERSDDSEESENEAILRDLLEVLSMIPEDQPEIPLNNKGRMPMSDEKEVPQLPPEVETEIEPEVIQESVRQEQDGNWYGRGFYGRNGPPPDYFHTQRRRQLSRQRLNRFNRFGSWGRPRYPFPMYDYSDYDDFEDEIYDKQDLMLQQLQRKQSQGWLRTRDWAQDSDHLVDNEKKLKGDPTIALDDGADIIDSESVCDEDEDYFFAIENSEGPQFTGEKRRMHMALDAKMTKIWKSWAELLSVKALLEKRGKGNYKVLLEEKQTGNEFERLLKKHAILFGNQGPKRY